MITFINEWLFSKTTEKMDGRDGRPDFYRTIISTGMAAVVDKKNPEKVTSRVIEHVLHTKEDNWNVENTRVGVKFKNNRGFLRISQKDTNRFDTNVFFIAIPYNGFIAPVERSKNFTIYKAFTVTVEEPIPAEGESFKHVAYLILVPNRKVIEDEKTACEICITGYSTRTDEEEKKTIKRTTTIEFYNRGGVCDYEITTKDESVLPVNMEDYTKQRIFPVTLPRKNDNHGNLGEKPRKQNHQGNKPPQKKDYKKTSEPKRNSEPKKKTLDQMIKDAEFDSGHVKHKRGKNRKKRR